MLSYRYPTLETTDLKTVIFITIKVYKEQKIQVSNYGEKGPFSNINEENTKYFNGIMARVTLEK